MPPESRLIGPGRRSREWSALKPFRAWRVMFIPAVREGIEDIRVDEDHAKCLRANNPSVPVPGALDVAGQTGIFVLTRHRLYGISKKMGHRLHPGVGYGPFSWRRGGAETPAAVTMASARASKPAVVACGPNVPAGEYPVGSISRRHRVRPAGPTVVRLAGAVGHDRDVIGERRHGARSRGAAVRSSSDRPSAAGSAAPRPPRPAGTRRASSGWLWPSSSVSVRESGSDGY
jgi:hypothetical protein